MEGIEGDGWEEDGCLSSMNECEEPASSSPSPSSLSLWGEEEERERDGEKGRRERDGEKDFTKEYCFDSLSAGDATR